MLSIVSKYFKSHSYLGISTDFFYHALHIIFIPSIWQNRKDRICSFPSIIVKTCSTLLNSLLIFRLRNTSIKSNAKRFHSVQKTRGKCTKNVPKKIDLYSSISVNKKKKTWSPKLGLEIQAVHLYREPACWLGLDASSQIQDFWRRSIRDLNYFLRF